MSSNTTSTRLEVTNILPGDQIGVPDIILDTQPPDATVVGRVIDDNGYSVMGALVQLIGRPSLLGEDNVTKPLSHTTSDENGFYLLNVPQDIDYSHYDIFVVVSYPYPRSQVNSIKKI